MIYPEFFPEDRENEISEKKVFEQLNLTLTSVCYRPILGVFRQATYVLDGVE